MQDGSADETVIDRPTPADGVREELVAWLGERARALNKRGVHAVSLVGSLARGEGRAGSDVDLLVELAPGATFDLVDLVLFKEELAVALGRKVDILCRGGLRPYVAEAVERDALRLL
jgi:predicted nucleotidyltransferase